MSVKSIASYKGLQHRSMPRDTRDKDYQYHLDYVSSVFHRYLTGYDTELRYEWEYLKTLEKYAKDEQGARKVKEKLLRQEKDGTFKGRMKDVFQTFGILPELIDIMISNNMRADYRPTSMAIDKVSLQDKEMEKGIAKFLVQEQTKEFLTYMGIKVNTVLTPEEIQVYNDTDIEVLFKTGGIQLQREMDAVASCNDTMSASRHKEIENMSSFDLITYGIAATKTYIDHSEDNVKYRYVDPKKLIVPRSKYNDFRDINYCGEIVLMRLHEIISQCPTIRPEQIKDLIENRIHFNKDYAGLMGSGDIDGYINGSNNIFDEFFVPCLDLQWLASEHEVYLQTETSNRGTMYKSVKRDYTLTKKQEKKGASIDRKKYIKRYEALWVIGSEVLLNYGEAKDNTYYGPKGKRIPALDYSVVKTGRKSLVARVMNTIDDINLNVAKHRSAIASMPPGPGLIIYEHALQNVKFNGKLQKTSDLISGLVEGGVLIVNGRDSKGNYIVSNGGKAVEPIPATAIQQITVFSNEIVAKVNQLRQLLGLPEGLDGTAGSPYTGVGQVQLAASASSNALFPTLSRIGPLYENTLEKAVLKWQLLSKKKGINVQTGFGNSYKVLALSKDFSNYDFKIKVVFAPTEEEKAFLLDQVNQMAIAYVQSAGSMGCSKAEFFMLYKLIKSNLIDEAQYQVARIEKLREENNLKISRENMQANIEQNNNSIRENSMARINEINEEARQQRLTEAAKEKNREIGNMKTEYLKSYDTESGAIPARIYQELVDDSNADIAAIEQESASGGLEQQQQQQQVPEEMVQQ